MTKPLYFWNGSSFELVGPTTPQSPFAYQTSAPTAPATGDIWIDSDGDVDTYNRQLTRYYFVATAGQTSVSGIDANGLTLAYVAGSEAVYVNGALQVRGVDYTATNGTSITNLSALALNDVVEVFAYTAFTVANAYTKTETDSVAAAAPGLRLVVPTSVAVGSGTGSANAAGYVTFSSASSVSLNGVFTSTYDNYRLVFTTTSNTASGYINMRLRSAGTDITAGNYFSSVVQAAYGSTAIGNDAGGNSQSTWNRFGYYDGTTDAYASSGDILLPFVSAFTSFNAIKARSGYGSEFATGVYKATTSVDGITIYSAGNFTGTVAVYGYKD